MLIYSGNKKKNEDKLIKAIIMVMTTTRAKGFPDCMVYIPNYEIETHPQVTDWLTLILHLPESG